MVRQANRSNRQYLQAWVLICLILLPLNGFSKDFPPMNSDAQISKAVYKAIKKKTIKPYKNILMQSYNDWFESCDELEYYVFGAAIKDGFSFQAKFTGCYSDFLEQNVKQTDSIVYGVQPSFRPLHYGFHRERKFHPSLCINDESIDLCHDSQIVFEDREEAYSDHVSTLNPPFKKMNEQFECFYGDARMMGFDSLDLRFSHAYSSTDSFPTVMCVFQYDFLENVEDYPFTEFETDVIRFMGSQYMTSQTCLNAFKNDQVSPGTCALFYKTSVTGLERMR